MKEKNTNKISKKGLWSQKCFEDKLNSETSNEKLFTYRLSPKIIYALGPF